MKAQSRKFRITARFFTGVKRYFIMAVFASLITTILNSLTPQIFRFTIDSVLGSNEYPLLSRHLWVMALVVIGVAVLSGIFLYIGRVGTALAGETFAKNMRDALFVHVQKLPMKWHDKNQTGDIIQRCTSDVEVIRNFVVTQLLEEKRARVKVLRSTDKWYGVTYREDKPQVVAAIAAMTQSGLYPERLWDI